MNREAWQATVHGVTRVEHNLVTKPPPPLWGSQLPAFRFLLDFLLAAYPYKLLPSVT